MTFLQSYQSDASKARPPKPGLTALQSVAFSTHDSTLPSESQDRYDVDDGIEPMHLALSLNLVSFRDGQGLNKINAGNKRRGRFRQLAPDRSAVNPDNPTPTPDNPMLPPIFIFRRAGIICLRGVTRDFFIQRRRVPHEV